MLESGFLQNSLRKHLSGTEGFVDNAPGLNGLELGANEGRAFARLHVQELDHAPNGTVELDRGAGAKVVAGDHSRRTVQGIIRLCQSPFSTWGSPWRFGWDFSALAHGLSAC